MKVPVSRYFGVPSVNGKRLTGPLPSVPEPPPDPSQPAAWSLPATINVAQNGTISLRQYAINATGWAISVAGLPIGVVYSAATESLVGAASGTGTATATFTLSKSGETSVVSTRPVNLYEAGDWQLPTGHWEKFLELEVLYPQPDQVGSDDGAQPHARHRHAYPGILYEIPIGVMWGAWPYKYEKISGPAWLDIVQETMVWVGDRLEYPEGYGVLAGIAPGTPQTAQPVVVRVTDQSGDFVDVTFSVAVSADNFVFVDPINGDDATATGLIGAPYKELAAMQESGLHDRKICYIRQTPAFSADTSTFAGGYKFGRLTADNRPITLISGYPHAYINFPGEYVGINNADCQRFVNLQGSPVDTFLAGIDVRYTNQTERNVNNVKVISGGKMRRHTVWRLTCVRPWGGWDRRDNHGFISHVDNGGNVHNGTGHFRTYFSELQGNELSVDPSAEAAFGGWGSNGSAFVQTYTAQKHLVERCVVKNSRTVNKVFFHQSNNNAEVEHRACDTTENNIGGEQMLTPSSMINVTSSAARQNQGYTRIFQTSYCKVGNLSSATGGVIKVGKTVSPAPENGTDFYMFRNSMPGTIPGRGIVVKGNVAGSVNTNNIATNNLEIASNRASFVDESMNLVGDPRAQHLGTIGAEIA